jgi:hypothetical protein
MNLFGLIIQRTTSGLNDMYVSENLKEIRLSSEIEQTTDDENKYATKLANQSDVYAVQLTTNYRVYSLVITDATDSFGRAGFYAIRLYAPKKYPLANFEVILQQINKKYQEYENDGTTKNSQEYDNLLRYETPLEVKQQDFLHAKSNENTFCHYDPKNTQLSNLFNAKSVALFNKLYAFNQERAVSSEIIKSLGLKSFEETKSNLKETFVTNNYKILKELKINNTPIEFNPNHSDFTVVLKKDDIIEYNTTDDLKFRQATGAIINVELKRSAQPKTRGPKKQTFLEEFGLYLIVAVMIAVLGIGSWYFILRDDTPVPTEYNQESIDQQPQVNNQNIIFISDPEGSPMDSTYKTNFPKLEKYRFQFRNKKWKYKNTEGKDEYNDFFVNNLNEIIKKDSLDFGEDLRLEFFKNLEVISGRTVSKKEVKENNAEEAKNKQEVTEKDSQKNNPKTKASSKTDTSNKNKSKGIQQKTETTPEPTENFKLKNKLNQPK